MWETLSATRLALLAKRHGAVFGFEDGRIAILNLQSLPNTLLDDINGRLGDVLSVIAEQSIPFEIHPSNVLDCARRLPSRARRPISRA